MRPEGRRYGFRGATQPTLPRLSCVTYCGLIVSCPGRSEMSGFLRHCWLVLVASGMMIGPAIWIAWQGFLRGEEER
jgi:hypothetical protein